MMDRSRTARNLALGMVLVLSLLTLVSPVSADPDFVISSEPGTSVAVGETYRYEIVTGASIENLSIVKGPEGMSLSDGVLTWTPDHEGNFEIMLMALDQYHNVASQYFTIRVLPSDQVLPTVVILRPLTGSEFDAGEAIEVRGVVGSSHDLLELTPQLDGKDLAPVTVTGHGDWAYRPGDLVPGKHSLTVRVGRPDGPSLNETTIEFEVRDEPFKLDSVYMVFAPVFLGLLSVSMVAMCDAGIYNLSSLFIAPFYSRIKKEKVLDRYMRGRVFEYINNNPGVTYSNIKRAVGISNGCLTYHLKVLNNTEMIHSKRNGTFRHFYPKAMPIPKVVFRLSPPQKSILEILDEEPGICQKNLAREAGMTNTALNYHIKLLRTAGIISVKRVGKRTMCYRVEYEGHAMAKP